MSVKGRVIMISQILGFSVLFILVFGGSIGAIVKFTLQGNLEASVNNRISEKRIEDALNPTDETDENHCNVREIAVIKGN